MFKFANGKYFVKITNISYGVSEYKKTPYFLCRFEGEYYEDDYRFVEKRFYQTKNSIPYIKKIFNAAGIDTNDLNPEKLIGSILKIEVTSGGRVNSNSQYYTYPEVSNFFKIEKRLSYDDNDYDDCNDIGWTAFIFGVDISEIASEMGMDPSDVNENTIREYCGY